MRLEELSKSQIILLTLFVSFMTSIATGIVTVSLMQQAPPAITQTVNRVVEHTVEKLVPTASGTQTASVTTEKTVIVNDSDLISQAVARVSPSIVQLYSSDPQAPIFYGLGIVLDSSGNILTDASAIASAGDANIQLGDGTKVRAFVTARDSVSGVAFLAATSSDASSTPTWTPAVIADAKLTLGESVVALSGKSIPRIANGLVTALTPLSGSGAQDEFDTSISADSIMAGSPVINTDGAVLGVSTGISRSSSLSGFISAAVIMKSNTKGAAKETSQ